MRRWPLSRSPAAPCSEPPIQGSVAAALWQRFVSIRLRDAEIAARPGGGLAQATPRAALCQRVFSKCSEQIRPRHCLTARVRGKLESNKTGPRSPRWTWEEGGAGWRLSGPRMTSSRARAGSPAPATHRSVTRSTMQGYGLLIHALRACVLTIRSEARRFSQLTPALLVSADGSIVANLLYTLGGHLGPRSLDP